jgi:hypothetical protein
MGSDEASNKDEDGHFKVGLAFCASAEPQRHAVDPITLEPLSTSPHDVETGQISMVREQLHRCWRC